MDRREYLREYRKVWYSKNKEKKLVASREWYEKNKDRKRTKQKEWNSKNREAILDYRSKWMRGYRVNNPEKIKEISRRDRENHKENYQMLKKRSWEKRRELLNRIKMRPCMDCGIQYNPWIMQFDHRDPAEKEFCPSGNCGIARMEEELKKCDVVCANCHAERTHSQRETGLFKRATNVQ